MTARRFLLIFVLSPVLVVLGAVATWAYWTTSGAGTASASTGTINAPTAVADSSTPGSSLVVVAWTNSAPAAGLSPSGYYVTRVRNSDSATFDACGSSAASPAATTPCNDTSVPDGNYHYVVTGVLATWTATSASSSNVTIDTTAPTVTGVSSTLANGSYKAAQVIPVTVTFSEAVTVTGTPKLTLSTGSPATTAVSYTSGSGTSVLTFNYTVAAGNTSPDLDYALTTSLALNSGTIQDLATNNATLTLASPGAAGSLGANKNLVINTSLPTVTGVSSTLANGSYKAAQVIPVTVTFSEAVTVTGTPKLTLSTGSPATTAVSYTSGSGTSVLTFNYTVAAGNTSPDLDYALTTSLALNSGTIQDLATNNATLTLASPGAAGSLGANKSLVIDTTAAVVSVTSVNGSVRTFPYSTNVNVASIGGTCGTATGDSVTVSPLINGVATAPATATCSSGAWTLTLTTALTTEASSTLSATQTDTAGNTGSATSQTVTIDKTASTLGISSCTAGTGQNTVAGTTNDNETTVSVKIFIGPGTGGTLFTTLTSPTPIAGSWSVTTAVSQLSAGATYTAQATQIDLAGNISNQPTCTFSAN